MEFVFKYPVFAYVESSTADASGTTTFKNPLTLAVTGDKQVSIEIVPIFTDEPKALAFKQTTKAPQTRLLRILAHEHLIDFLTKASSRAKKVAIDPTPPALSRDRVWTVEQLIDAVRKEAAKRQSR